MHIASIPFPWMAPLVGLLIGKGQPFLRHHSWKALKGQIITGLIVLTVTAASLSHSLYSLYQQYQEGFRDFNLWSVVVKSIAVWVGLFLFGLWNTVASVLDAKKALIGDWGRVKRPGPELKPR